MQDAMLIEGLDNTVNTSGAALAAPAAPPRLARPDRHQVLLEAVNLDERLPADHQARTIWAVVERLDLAAFYDVIAARGSEPGRPAIDPRVLVALWLYAATDGVGSGRELDRLCGCHDAYRWLCGGLPVNYHTLNDFRTGFGRQLDGLFTQVLGKLTFANVVTVARIAQDGTRVRASAGSASFRTGATLREHLAAAQGHVEALKRQGNDPAVSARERAAQERAAAERLARAERALAELPLAEAAKTRKGQKVSRYTQARVSTTDPEARRMKMSDGGFRPAYNLQLAADTASRAIVGLLVSKAGTDAGLNEVMRRQVQDRTGLQVGEHLTDGGYTKMEDIPAAASGGTTIYRPPPPLQKSGERTSPYQPCPTDTPEVAMWRELMGTPEAREIYQERGSTIETVNADLKTHRGLGTLGVRGIAKVTCVALWSALAYNVMHFADVLLTT
jgi:transposase